MPKQDPYYVSKEELHEALTSEDIPFGVKVHALREFHYQQTQQHMPENIAGALILLMKQEPSQTVH